MDIARNKEGKRVDIKDANKSETYYCYACGGELIAKIGNKKQYFSHKIHHNDDCDIKVKKIMQQLKSQEKAIYEVSEDLDIFKNPYNNDVEDINGFTDEQLLVINSKDKRIIVNAVAGSGKTSTLEEFVKRNPNRRILYLTFNRGLAEESKEKFGDISYVEIRTIHSYAYKYAGADYRNILTSSLNIFDVAKAINIFAEEPEQFKYLEDVLEHFDSYLLSKYKSIKEYCIDKQLSGNMFKHLTTLFDKSKSKKMKVTHNFYYKLWHLSNPQFLSFDTLCIDEIQDVNEALVDIIESNVSLDKIIVVGDQNQALYKFAKCVNAFELLDENKWKKYTLSKSFRIGNTLAKTLTTTFNEDYFKNFNMVGMNKNQRIVQRIDTSKPYYELCRFNATIIENIIKNTLNNKKVYIEGGKAGVSFAFIKSLYEFKYHGKKSMTFKKYEDYDHLINSATKVNDYEILFAHKLIITYGESLLLKIRSAEENIIENWEDADISYSSIHKSKGYSLTIPMRISGDLISLLEAKEKFSKDDFITECNLLYVACTRCKNEIELPNAFWEIYKKETI